jgi:uncharacterized protein YegL
MSAFIRKHAASLVHAGDNDERKSFSFFAVGVEGANMAILAQVSRREPLKLQGLRFRDLFAWLSSGIHQTDDSFRPFSVGPTRCPLLRE